MLIQTWSFDNLWKSRIYTGGGSGHRPDKLEVAEEHGHEEINMCVMWFLKYNLYNLEISSIFLTFKSLLIFSMDGCIWISGFAVIILKYLLAGCFWIIVEIPGVYTTRYSVRVVFGPSRVRVGQKISSTSRVSSTRRALLETRADIADVCNNPEVSLKHNNL